MRGEALAVNLIYKGGVKDRAVEVYGQICAPRGADACVREV